MVTVVRIVLTSRECCYLYVYMYICIQNSMGRNEFVPEMSS